ncbi:MAG: bifunctional methylenetetrahydrofolate dehydrogenase/methenyltetrahydrofolate cyclohydrolase FolD [Thermodesulfobacteriota bacterium]
MAEIIDGKALALEIRKDIKKGVEEFHTSKGVYPGLAVVLVGDNPSSLIYVKMKARACKEASITSIERRFPLKISQEKLLDVIDSLNKDHEVHGILVQLPLPDGIDTTRVLEAVSPEKDVDGFHPCNMGRLLIGRPSFIPCTPYGIINMLESKGIKVAGKEVVVVGRSNIVGKPIALLLLHRHATVTLCHSKTKNLPGKIANADILIAAVGRAEMIKGNWIKNGAVVIDVGVNRLEDGRLAGDVAFEEASKRASYITPVPGGVGPVTITMLLKNTLNAAKSQA